MHRDPAGLLGLVWVVPVESVQQRSQERLLGYWLVLETSLATLTNLGSLLQFWPPTRSRQPSSRVGFSISCPLGRPQIIPARQPLG